MKKADVFSLSVALMCFAPPVLAQAPTVPASSAAASPAAQAQAPTVPASSPAASPATSTQEPVAPAPPAPPQAPVAAPPATPPAPSEVTPLNTIQTALLARFPDLKPTEVSGLSLAAIGRVTPDTVKHTPTSVLVGMTPEQLGALSTEARLALTKEQIDPLSSAQKDALGKDIGLADSDTPVGELKRGRTAIQPGIRLMGDAYTQLASAAGSTTPNASFGGGVEIETLNWRTGIIVRKGTQPGVLTDRKSFGASMLSPSVQNFYAGLEGARYLKGIGDGDSFVLSIAGFAQIARTQWDATLVEAVPAVTDAVTGDVTTPATSATTASTGATTTALSVGPELKYVASQGENYVEIRAFLGLGLRGVSLDRDADSTVDKARKNNPSVPSGGFLQNAIGTTTNLFGSLDSVLSLRINSVVISASVPYVGGNVPGLSGLNFVPSIALRTGARLIEL